VTEAALTEREAEASIAQALTGACDWDRCGLEALARVPALALSHGVEGLLWTELSGIRAAAAVRDALTPTVRAAVARDMLVQRELQGITTALAQETVAALITKGSALAYSAYPEPWLRPRVDTDVLVRQSDVATATGVLERCGYVRSDATNTGALVSHQIGFERAGSHDIRHVIDLHWKIVNPHIVADALAFDDLWRSSSAAPALGPAARVPGAVESIAISCIHRLAHHQRHDRLIWLYDLRLLSASLDAKGWLALRDLACGRQIAGLCVDGLRAARSRVGGMLPADIEAALAEAAPSEPSRVYLQGNLSKSDVLLSDLKTLATWGARLRLLREHVFPPPAFIQQRYGTRARVLLPAFYLHRLIAGASRWVR